MRNIENNSIKLNGGIKLKEYINSLIKEYVMSYKVPEGSKTEWREPIAGFAAAEDPLFIKLKEIVCPEHKTPKDILPNAKTVITYFIPFANKLIKTNKTGESCSREWAQAYIETNKMLGELAAYLVGKIEEKGFEAKVAGWHFDTEKLISDWSQRHVAYISGLGTFGINNMLITDKGCTGRYGSIVTNLEIEPDKRPDTEYCMYKRNGSCGICVEKCIAGALRKDGFDRKKCYQVCKANSELYKEFGDAEACGKCLTMVPCSLINPTKGGC